MADTKTKYDLLQQTVTVSNLDNYSVIKLANNSNIVEINGRYNPIQSIYSYLKASKGTYTSLGLFANCTTSSMPIIAQSIIQLPISLKPKSIILTSGFDHSKLDVGNKSTTKLPNGNHHGNVIVFDDDSGNDRNKYTNQIACILGISRQFALALIDEIENKSVDPSNYGIYINYHVIGEL